MTERALSLLRYGAESNHVNSLWSFSFVMLILVTGLPTGKEGG